MRLTTFYSGKGDVIQKQGCRIAVFLIMVVHSGACMAHGLGNLFSQTSQIVGYMPVSCRPITNA